MEQEASVMGHDDGLGHEPGKELAKDKEGLLRALPQTQPFTQS